MSRPFVIFLSTIAALALILMIGCGDRESAAQKLFAQGKYQEVIEKYADLQIAQRARAMLAEDLVKQGKYDEVLKDFADTRAAYQAQQAKAQQLIAAGNFRAVIDLFPKSEMAKSAENKLATELYNQGMFDSLIASYPESESAKQVKDARAAEAFEAAKKMKGEKQIAALEKIMKDYTQSPIYKDAANLLREIRQPADLKKKAESLKKTTQPPTPTKN